MRIDKFLKVTRILKRRTVAQDACSGNKVSVNGRTVKPAYAVKIGDIVEIKFGTGFLKIKVLSLQEHVKKEDVETMYEVLN